MAGFLNHHSMLSRSTSSTAALLTRDLELDPKVVSAAHQFEASLMQELLKPLNESVLAEEGESGDAGEARGLGGSAPCGDGSGGALMSFSSEALAKGLSEKGGLGIARRVLDHFETQSGARNG